MARNTKGLVVSWFEDLDTTLANSTEGFTPHRIQDNVVKVSAMLIPSSSKFTLLASLGHTQRAHHEEVVPLQPDGKRALWFRPLALLLYIS